MIIMHILTAPIETLQYSLHRMWSMYVLPRHSSPSAGEHVLDPSSRFLAIKILQKQVHAHRQTYLWQFANDGNTSESSGEGPLDLPQSLISSVKMLSLHLILAFLPTN